jgi:hypothetical protein
MNEQPDYEALYITLYAYRFGRISFVELLEQLELALGLSHQAKMLDLDIATDKCEAERRRYSDIA